MYLSLHQVLKLEKMNAKSVKKKKKKKQNLETESSTLKDHDDDDDHLTVEATV